MAFSPVNLTWNSVLQTICSSSSSSSGNKGERKCPVRLLDTVFLDESSTHAAPEWYFTTKVGMISKKKVNKSTFPSILDRFSKFALANSNNTQGYVGVTRSYANSSSSSSNSRKLWSTASLNSACSQGVDTSTVVGKGTYLQVYLQPHQNIDAVFVIEGSREGSSSSGGCVFRSFKRVYTASDDQDDGFVPDNIFMQMQSYLAEVIDFFEKNRGLRTQHVVAEFVVDDNEHVWLSCISKLSAITVDPTVSDELSSSTGLSRKMGSKHRMTVVDDGSGDKENQYVDRTFDSRITHDPHHLSIDVGMSFLPGSPSRSPTRAIPGRPLSAGSNGSKSLGSKGGQGSPTQAWSVNGSPLAFCAYNGIGSSPGSPLHTQFLVGKSPTKSPIKSPFKSPNKNPLLNLPLHVQGPGEGLSLPTNVLAQALASASSSSCSSSSSSSTVGLKVSKDIDRQGLGQGQGQLGQGQGQGSGQQLDVDVVASDVEKEFVKRQLNHTVTATDNNGKKHLSIAHATQQLSQQHLSQQQLSHQQPQSQPQITAGGVFSELTNVLQDRLVVLERQVQTLTHQLERKDIELDKSSEKLRKAKTEAETAKRLLSTEKNQLKDAYEKEMLVLKEQHMKEMAAAVGAPVRGTLGITSDGAGTTSKSSHQPTTTEANKQLLSQLEDMRMERKKLQEQFEDERRMLQYDASSKIAAQEMLLKSDITELRKLKTVMEDKVTQLNEDLTSYKTKSDSLTMLCRQMELTRDEALEGQARLRSEMKVMQQSVTATKHQTAANSSTSGMFSSGGGSSTASGGGGDVDAVVKLCEAKYEAKLRQQTNKIDFLKSQLSAEQATVEELRTASEVDHNKLDDLRTELRLKLQETERLKDEAVSEAEKRIERVYEERMYELTGLQTKMKSVQSQLKEAFDETSLAKQREEAAKGTLINRNAEQALLKAEIEQLKDALQSIREEREQEEAKSGAKQNQDATVRRLDNERQYLKSQLASEVTLKNELQEALFVCQTKLSETQKRWHEDVEEVKETAAKASQDAGFAHQRLHHTACTLEAEVAQVTSQNKELKENFSKMRDQVRAEQLALENMTLSHHRLKEQLEDSRLESLRVKQAEEHQNSVHERQIATLNALVTETEQRHHSELTLLRDELSKQCLANSTVQKDTLYLLKSFDVERREKKLQLAASRMLDGLRRLKLNRIASMFRTWSTNSTLMGVALQFRGTMETLVKSTLEEAQRDKEIALETLRVESQEVLALQEDRLRQEFEAKLQQLQASEQEERELLASKRELMMQEMLRNVEDRYNDKLAIVRESHEESLAEADELLHNELSALSAQHEAALAVVREEGVAHATQLQQLTDERLSTEWSQKMNDCEEEWTERARKAMVTADLARVTEIQLERKKASDRLTDDLTLLRTELLVEHEAALAAAASAHVHTMSMMLEQCDREKKELVQGLEESHTAQSMLALQQQQESTRREIGTLREEWVREMDLQRQTREEEYQQSLASKLSELAETLEAEKARALKLEASKWKQAMKEAEKRLTLEVKAGYDRGRDEREAEMTAALEDAAEIKQLENQAALTEKLKAAMDEMQRDHAEKMAIQEAKLRAQQEEAAIAAEKVVDMQVAFERAKTDALIEAESTLRGRLALEWTERLQQEVATALEQAAAAHRQEIAKHEELNRDYEQMWHGKMAELTTQFETERADWHLTEAQKLQETLLAAEERWQVEVQLALARGQQEKEQQLQVELFAIENRSDAEIYELKVQLKASQEHASANAHWQGEFLKHVEESEKMLKKLEKARHAEHKKMSEEIESERERSKAVLAGFEEDLRVKHELALDELRNQQLLAQESLLASAKAQWDEEMLRADASREEERQTAVRAQFEEHAVAMEAEKARALKLEASKWKQAMKEAEKRVALEVAQAKEQGREEREAELRREQASFEEHLTTSYTLAAQAEKEIALEVLESAHKEQLEQLRDDLLRERVELAAIEAQKVEERLSEGWTERIADAVASAVAQAEMEHKIASSALQAQHDKNLMEQLQGRYNQGAEETSAKYLEKIKELEDGYQVALEGAERQKRVDAEVLEGLEQAMRLDKEAHHTAIETLHKEIVLLSAKIQGLETDRNQLQLWLDQSEEMVRCVETDKRSEQELLRKEWESERDQFRDEITALQSVKQDLFEASEQRIRELRASWEQETLYQMTAKDQELDKKLSLKMDEMTATVEAEKARALKLEASKWKQALKEAEKRTALEVAQAKSHGREEREAELRHEQAVLEENKMVEQEAAELRHRAAMDTLLTEHELKFLQWKTSMDNDRQEALQRIENVTREMVSEDWAHRLQLAVNEAVENADAVSKAKVSKQQDALEEFKRDMVVQTQRLADERNDLQQRCEETEASLARSKTERRIEVDRLQHDFEDDREALVTQFTTKHQREMEILTEKLTQGVEEQREAAVVAATRGLEQRLEQAHRGAIEQVDELSRQLTTITDENNRLTAQLREESIKAVDAQDSLFDTQQALKLKQKELSLMVWKLAAGAFAMKAATEKTIKEMESKKVKQDDGSKLRLQHSLHHMTLTVLHLGRQFVLSNDLRKRMDESLRSYRVDDLNDKRRRIKLLERDIERFNEEAEEIHEQRGDVEEEVSRLETQVHSVEEQLRTHSQSSSTTNGRINVAHAHKKKRLDSEFERLLSQIESKRDVLQDLEEKLLEKARVRDERATEMIDIEKELVNILCEQQKVVLSLVQQSDKGQGSDAQRVCERLIKEARIPWPPPEQPSMNYVNALFAPGGVLHDAN